MDGFKTSLPSFVKEYLYSLVKKKRKPSTVKRYIYDLEDFFIWLEIEKRNQSFVTWANLTHDDIQRYLSILTESRSYSPRTTKRVLTVLNQLYKYYDNLGLSKNPILEINIIDCGEVPMTSHDFLNEKEVKQLFLSLHSTHDLSEKQLETRHLIVDRNEAIFLLFLYHGLTLQELTNLQMNHIHFETNTITVASLDHEKTIHLSSEHKQVMYKYYETIPKPVRPRYHENDPFFVAFDFQRGTYRWVYEEENKPKQLTNIAIQRMIQKEVKRSGLRKGISAQHLRNTFILTEILAGKSISTIQQQLGLKTDISLKKFFQFATQV
ncbi:tyrosine-type recombinase/integrase [Anaerobacillus isosaccharinicus]|uniref:Site-specific integrase n=1 Tax=Anaerobacillus isosaccharinicus TaxID=1532552 RepID=A0A1S2M8S7_9BACI|nr:tyrosine-type recombinase/integrase [Anaerobacillus isosaccharinicus]MBA5587247.1 site-specific integrase [Anaerobacillus isosaccharinicus]QOY34559.1 site-specific integrase [Anaerobacillus isosaccharinicus]